MHDQADLLLLGFLVGYRGAVFQEQGMWQGPCSSHPQFSPQWWVSIPLHRWYLSIWGTCFSSRFPEPSPMGMGAWWPHPYRQSRMLKKMGRKTDAESEIPQHRKDHRRWNSGLKAGAELAAGCCVWGIGIMVLGQLGLQLEENMVGSHSRVTTNSRWFKDLSVKNKATKRKKNTKNFIYNLSVEEDCLVAHSPRHHKR